MLCLLVYQLLLRAQPHAAKVAAMTDNAEVTDEPPLTREELLTALMNVNARAMEISRRGYVGIMSAEYKRRHADINDLLNQLVGR